MKITIVGGGSSGWMTAAYLSTKTDHIITLIQSSDIPNIGVGESTLPSFYDFITELGLTEQDLFNDCDATRKYTIRHKDWNKDGDWFHHFCFTESEHTEQQQWMDSYALPNKKWRHAYHIDANKLAIMLRDKVALPNGVKIITSTLDSIDNIQADYIINCSGFNNLFPKKPLVSTKLINNRAIVCPSNTIEHKPYTQTTALSSGWMWTIALQNRIGSGYVFCDKFISDADAKQEFISNCPYKLDIEKMRVIGWTPGYVQQPWSSNIIDVGLSAGFLEPLEAQALWATQYQLEMLVRLGLSEKSKRVFNKQWVRIMKHTEKYLLLHYTASTRRDSRYWNSFDTVDAIQFDNTQFNIFGKYSFKCLANGYALPYIE